MSASERAFSVAGNIVTQRRCTLATQTVENLHFLHDNYWILDEKDETDAVIDN
jgi:hypothetical protein